jgi:histone acetyltransferase MYST1
MDNMNIDDYNNQDDESGRPTPPPLLETDVITSTTTSGTFSSQNQPKNKRNALVASSTQPVSHTMLDVNDRKSPSAVAQDTHPYARGAVIEVWHIPKSIAKERNNNSSNNHGIINGTDVSHYDDNNDTGDDDWWSEESSDDEEEQADRTEGSGTQTGHRTVRLCDIIDRVPTTSKSSSGVNWRYYVHYRDFNRRMDEWIHASRIVSPPSVGNAKARALKREEERNRKRKLLEQQEAAAIAAAAAATAAGIQQQRIRSRRSLSSASMQENGGTGRSETPDGRRTRMSRRKDSAMVLADDEAHDSVFADDDTALVLNTSTGSSNAAPSPKDNISTTTSMSFVPTMSALPTTATTNIADVFVTDTTAVTMTVVGEHTVATVQAVEFDEHEGMDASSLREHEEVTKVKNIGFLELGRYQMETWYFSPLPKELIHDFMKENSTGAPGAAASASTTGFLEVLYVCEFTFRMFARKCELQRFQRTIPAEDRHPPGNEIYRHGNLAMFEVDGLDEKIYCQNLCYIAKLFLDHKTLYFDVDPFLFYVLCEVDNRGYHPVGYYSKEKYSDVGYNLACILSFPSQQRKGYGRFLIAFSYELSKKEEKVGSPEKPLSDLGQQAYKPYWASTVIEFLLYQSDESALSIMDVAKRTSIMAEDIVYTLNQLGILKIINGVYFIAAERDLLTALAEKYPVKEPRVDPSKLHWTPFLTDVKRDKFSIHSKKTSLEAEGVNSNNTTSNG